MDKPLKDYGFSKDQMDMLPKDFVEFILSHYNTIELQTLSTVSIIKGASMLYTIYNPNKQPIITQ
ncbi:hypothetical protein COTS27_00329 [Spirochaetota bacterium]|nr:hypothetical protein COTS27_00329 [Spirochaetota bacterium]